MLWRPRSPNCSALCCPDVAGGGCAASTKAPVLCPRHRREPQYRPGVLRELAAAGKEDLPGTLTPVTSPMSSPDSPPRSCRLMSPTWPRCGPPGRLPRLTMLVNNAGCSPTAARAHRRPGCRPSRDGSQLLRRAHMTRAFAPVSRQRAVHRNVLSVAGVLSRRRHGRHPGQGGRVSLSSITRSGLPTRAPW